jgi:hypothetical protein
LCQLIPFRLLPSLAHGVGLQLDNGLIAAGDQKLLLLALAQHRGKDPPVVVPNCESCQQRDHGKCGEDAEDEGQSAAQTGEQDREVDWQDGSTLFFLGAPAGLHHHLRDHGSVVGDLCASIRGSGTDRRQVGSALRFSIGSLLGVGRFAVYEVADPEIIVAAAAHATPAER